MRSWRSVPIWTLASEVRSVVDPGTLGREVFHYSIPGLEETGGGRVEDVTDIRSAKLRLHGDEVLISKLNPRKSRVVMAQASEWPIVCSTEFVALRPNGVDPRFLYYLLRTETTRQTLDAKVQSVTRSHQRVNPEDVMRLVVSVPEVEEQRRIADFLDAETSVLSRSSSLNEQVASLVRERFAAVRDGLLEGMGAEFGELPLRRFVTTIEQGASPLCDAEPASDSQWGVLKLSSVKRGRFSPEENKRLPGGGADPRHEVRDGDLLVTRANTPDLVGDVAVVRGSTSRRLLPDLIYRVGLSKKMRPDYVAEVILGSRVRRLIEATARGSSQSMVKLRGEDIKAWPIPNIVTPLQDDFVARMREESERLERLLDAIDRQGQLLVERRQALMTAAVTGRIDVTTAREVDV